MDLTAFCIICHKKIKKNVAARHKQRIQHCYVHFCKTNHKDPKARKRNKAKGTRRIDKFKNLLAT